MYCVGVWMVNLFFKCWCLYSVILWAQSVVVLRIFSAWNKSQIFKNVFVWKRVCGQVSQFVCACKRERERERETVCASSIVCHSGYGVSLPFRPLPSSHTHALSCTHSNMHTLFHVQKPVAYLNILFSTVLIQYASHWDSSRTCRTCHTMTTDTHVEIKSHKCFPDSIAWTLYKIHGQQHQMNKVVQMVLLVIHENVMKGLTRAQQQQKIMCFFKKGLWGGRGMSTWHLKSCQWTNMRFMMSRTVHDTAGNVKDMNADNSHRNWRCWQWKWSEVCLQEKQNKNKKDKNMDVNSMTMFKLEANKMLCMLMVWRIVHDQVGNENGRNASNNPPTNCCLVLNHQFYVSFQCNTNTPCETHMHTS